MSELGPSRQDRDEVPTAPERVDFDRQRRARAVRRVFLALLALFVGAAVFGAYGPRERTTRAAGGGYELAVTFPSVTRPGLAVEWEAEVRREGGFDGPVTIGVTDEYFAVFDENGLDPTPSAATTAGDLLVWEFDPPDGDVLRVTFDARIEPGVQLESRRARAVVLEEGQPVVEVRFTTRVLF